MATVELPERLGWHVAETGYRWEPTWRIQDLSGPRQYHDPFGEKLTIEPKAEPELFLTTGRSLRLATPVRRYFPADKEGLFLSFIHAGESESGMIEFANRYGMLGAVVGDSTIALRDPDEPEFYVAGYGEPFTFWNGEAGAMKMAFRFWQFAQRRQVELLGRCIEHLEGGTVRVRYWEDRIGEGAPDWTGEVGNLPGSHRRDVVETALWFARHIINGHLANRIIPRVHVATAEGWLDTFLEPAGLIGFLWLQFAMAVKNSREFEACQGCDGFFELTTHAQRTGKQFCSDACKNRTYRKRQAREDLLHFAAKRGFYTVWRGPEDESVSFLGAKAGVIRNAAVSFAMYQEALRELKEGGLIMCDDDSRSKGGNELHYVLTATGRKAARELRAADPISTPKPRRRR
jgi:hypothetical protein